MTDYLSRDEYLAIKAAMRALVSLVGGTRAAAKINGEYRHQRYSELGAVSHMKDFPTVKVIADLEASCDTPVVTEALADLLGYVLVKLPEPNRARPLTENVGKVAKECGDVISALGAVMIDGEVDNGERARLHREVREAQAVLAEIDLVLADPAFEIEAASEATPPKPKPIRSGL